jgi:hypothetical protein
MEFESKSVYCIELISRIAVRSGFSEAATKMGHPERVSFSSIRTLTDLKSVWSGVKDYADHQ